MIVASKTQKNFFFLKQVKIAPIGAIFPCLKKKKRFFWSLMQQSFKIHDYYLKKKKNKYFKILDKLMQS